MPADELEETRRSPLGDPTDGAPAVPPPPYDPPQAPPGARFPGDDNGGSDANEGFDHFGPDYEIIEPMMTTRQSRTYKARNRPRDALAVVKQLHPELVVQPEALERFKREVHTVARLTSEEVIPGIVSVWDPHLDEWPYFYGMPFIDGEHLDAYCESNKLNLTARLRLFIKVCDPVGEAHKRGVIHRDLKPNNILVDRRGRPQLLDFGLGRVTVTGLAKESVHKDTALGALGYMAPEQAAGAPDSVRTDVYSLGVILFELLTESLPIPIERSESIVGALRRIRDEEPREPIAENPSVGWELNLIILKALEKDPDGRFQTVSELAQAVQNCLKTRPTPVLVAYANQRKEQRRPAVAPQPVPPLWWYMFSRYLQRNKWGVAAACVIGIGAVVATVVVVLLSLFAAENAEAGRHKTAVLAGRLYAKLGDPVGACQMLWPEQQAHDSLRTRYALLEFFFRYPCVAFVPLADEDRPIQIEYSPSGVLIATVDKAECVRIYKAPNAETQDVRQIGRRIPADRALATCLAFSPSGKTLYLGGKDGRIRRLDIEELDRGTIGTELDPADIELETVLSPAPRGVKITALAVSPDGILIAVGSQQDGLGRVSVWHQSKGEWSTESKLRRLHVGENATIVDLTFSHDGTKVACGARADELPGGGVGVGGFRIWSLPDGQPVAAEDLGTCRAIRFSADGGELYVEARVGSRSTIKRYNPLDVHESEATFYELPGLEPVAWGIRSLDTPSGYVDDLMAYSGGDGRVRLYDFRNGRMLSVRGYHVQHFSDSIDVSFSPKGRYLASVGGDGLCIWDRTPVEMHDIPCDDGESWGDLQTCGPEDILLFGTKQLTANEASTCVVFSNARSAVSPVAARDGIYAHVMTKPASSADGRFLAFGRVVGGDPNSVLLEIIDRNSDSRFKSDSWSGLPRVEACWIEGEPRWLVYSTKCPSADDEDGLTYTLHAWRMTSGGAMADSPERIHTLREECSGITTSPDGKWVVVGLQTRPELLVFRATQQRDATLFTEAFQLSQTISYAADDCWRPTLVQGPEGQPLVAAGGDRDLHIFDLRTGELYGALKGHRDAVEYCVSLGDGVLVSTGRDGRVLAWDLATREELGELYAHPVGMIPIAARGEQLFILEENRLITFSPTKLIQQILSTHRPIDTCIR